MDRRAVGHVEAAATADERAEAELARHEGGVAERAAVGTAHRAHAEVTQDHRSLGGEGRNHDDAIRCGRIARQVFEIATTRDASGDALADPDAAQRGAI